jgi:hypothetical protein
VESSTCPGGATGSSSPFAAHDELTVWRVEGGQVAQDGLIHCPVIDGPPGALAFAPSLPLLGWGGAEGVAIWAPGLHERPVASAGLHGDVTALAWHPAGDRFAVGTVRGSVACLRLP